MKKKIITVLTICLAFFSVSAAFAQKAMKLEVDASKPLVDIQPTMWGVFFEDINFAADGGIYAEMVKNRSFEFDNPLMGWLQPNSDRHSMNEKSGMATIVKEGLEVKKHFARVEIKNAKGYKLINEGFRGMGIKKDAKYLLTLNARKVAGDITKITFQFVDEAGKVLGGTEVKPTATSWKEYKASFVATATELKANLLITFEGTGKIDLDMVSLFPEDTWKGRPKGMRKDLVQLLADLNPGFLRFPGGCIVEGRTLEKRYQWKKTVGDIEDREMIVNRWNTEFDHRPTPDYFQTFGLGFFEYFQLAEDFGAEPLPILSCGIACQFNTGELVPLDELDPYVQDAIDLIEFANGEVSSKWGKLRADMGHPEPFNLKYIGVGNEQWGPDYFDRLKVFTKTIKEKYPEMIIVSGTGPFPAGEQFDYAEKELKKMNAEIVDEHYYNSPEWFLENADRYDSYDRDSYKIFAGEYACQSVAIASPKNKNNWQCAMSEAAYMTGLERNADVVYLTSYAPLFAHVDGWQWTPDLIWFNNLASYKTPNYHVQQLFSTNKGTQLISVLQDGKPLIGQEGIYASSVVDENSGEVIVKVVNSGETEMSVSVKINGARLAKAGKLIVLNSENLEVENSIEHPDNIVPEEKDFTVKGKVVTLSLPPYSLSVLKVKKR
ncbi:alpha-L-arabinofuranosidase C-terminal domain-containing protein [Flammeovirgaceae bacterium SG7u.111]|nr:alpha-L-arabinofuranosidase C-terminal domain-containing protein [Flammeovirgaceae bacterium SG7u.132]WPO34899.1 alpha-L-arabinofuranosidase C-terminal domain-containing protein [Flammeovirgaceae bacterium SG7u.111]